MKPLAVLLLLTVPAQAQWMSCGEVVICEPVQCYGGQYCQPQYAQPQYAQPQPQPQPILESPGSPERPPFEPRPEPLAPVKPVPAADSEENKKLLALMGQNTQILVQINATLKDQKPCPCDNSAVIAKLDAISAALAQQSVPVAPPGPSPAIEQHVVIVADQNAPYWQRLSQLIETTKQTYSGVALAPPPPFGVGVLPQAVVYKNQVPVRVAHGQYEVEAILSRLARSEPI